MDTSNPIKVITGTIGDDIHSFGIKVINHALESAGYQVISLGIQTPQEDFVKAAIESDALGDAAQRGWLMLFELLQQRNNKAAFESLTIECVRRWRQPPGPPTRMTSSSRCPTATPPCCAKAARTCPAASASA